MIQENQTESTWNKCDSLYSLSKDIFITDEDHLTSTITDLKCSIDSLDLVICAPIYLSPIEESYFEDELAEDAELPDDVMAALENLNKVIKIQSPSCWAPTKTKAFIPTI